MTIRQAENGKVVLDLQMTNTHILLFTILKNQGLILQILSSQVDKGKDVEVWEYGKKMIDIAEQCLHDDKEEYDNDLRT